MFSNATTTELGFGSTERWNKRFRFSLGRRMSRVHDWWIENDRNNRSCGKKKYQFQLRRDSIISASRNTHERVSLVVHNRPGNRQSNGPSYIHFVAMEKCRQTQWPCRKRRKVIDLYLSIGATLSGELNRRVQIYHAIVLLSPPSPLPLSNTLIRKQQQSSRKLRYFTEKPEKKIHFENFP